MALQVFLLVSLIVAIAGAPDQTGSQTTNANLAGGEPVSSKPSAGNKPTKEDDDDSDSDSSDSKDDDNDATNNGQDTARNSYYDSDSSEYSDSYEYYKN